MKAYVRVIFIADFSSKQVKFMKKPYFQYSAQFFLIF